MLETPPNQLIALTIGLQAAGLALTLARRVPPPRTSLSDQVVRSEGVSDPLPERGCDWAGPAPIAGR